MSDTLKTLQTVSTALLGAPCDTKMLTLWEHYVTKGGFTIDDFCNTIHKSPQFAEHCETLFKARCDTLGISLPWLQFWAGVDSYDDIKEKINAFITSTPLFIDKYTHLIKDIISYEINSTATDADVAFYLDIFSVDHTYDTLRLSDDVNKKLHIISSKFQDVVNGAPPQIDVKPNSMEAALFDVVRLDAFEAIFQRPMYVQEYFKYSSLTIGLDELFAQHTTSYNRMREIFETFTGKTISEYYYVHKFLFSIDNPEFFENIIDDIVNSVEYKNSMMRVIAEKYAAMFDTTMSEIDVDYMFNIVKTKKLPIISDDLVQILNSVKQESDDLIGNIIKVYSKVLDRPPDMNEIEQYVTYYRGGGTDSALEKILMRTLEFHDSIKKRIRIEYQNAKGREVLPSTLFDVLNRVIVGIADLDMASIDDTIRNFLV